MKSIIQQTQKVNCMKIKLSRIFVLSLFLFTLENVSAQKVNFEFLDQKYGDILYALSSYRGISIVADDTISGSATFQFAGTDFEKAFEAFLLINRLYVSKKDTVWTISKISIKSNPGGTDISLDALDVTPSQILDHLSRSTGKTIIFDLLPSSKISLHISAGSVEGIAEIVMKPFPTYSIEKNATSLLIKRSTEPIPQVPSSARMTIEHTGKTYTAEINQARVSELIDRLCKEENIEYSNFIRNDLLLSGIRISGKSFDEFLEVILEQAGAESVEKNGIRYFLPSALTDTAKKLRDSTYEWKEYGTNSIRVKDATALLALRFPGLQIVQLTGSNNFIAQVTEKTAIDISGYLSLIDKKGSNEIIFLKYISTSDFFKTLPPSIRKEELVDTGTGNSFFFNGPAELKNQFMSELKEIDKPKERIRYDMLIIQYENSSSSSWGINAEIKALSPGDMTSVSGSFGSLLNLNFDVITLFGYQFSARLNTALSENRAQVFADTTIHGMTGENIKFQNTSTYRYRDSNVDPETGKSVYTGITREIVSGVVLEINGWVSGDGMVTMNIRASVSKRGVDVSGKSGNPPPTSEKSITTKLNTANGEPVILSGLTQNDSSIVEQRLPFLSRIPLIGWAFRNRNTTNEKTEMVIYIVPHITNGSDTSYESSALANTAFERLVLPFIKE